MNRTRLDLLDSLPKGGVCAELGVFEGKFSEEILKRTQPQKLFLVDLFQGEVVSGDENGENLTSVDMTNEYKRLCARFGTDYRVQVLRMSSIDWLAHLADSQMDWLYIDTVHDYNHTKRELDLAFLVVKNGGFICGHDYNEKQYPGVVLAVDEFCSRFHELKCEIFDGNKLASYKIEVKK